MNFITKFFHELMNPHCEHCESLQEVKLEEAKYCKTCEVLQMQLAVANAQATRFAERLYEVNKTSDQVIPTDEIKQAIIQTRAVPWHVKRQQLEDESRARALAITKAAKPDSERSLPDTVTESVQNLEKELGIGDARS